MLMYWLAAPDVRQVIPESIIFWHRWWRIHNATSVAWIWFQ